MSLVSSMTTPIKELRLMVPKRVYDKLEDLEKRLNVRKEDIILRALVKVIEEEFE